MALIKCPECDQSISDKALKCPKCGCPIKEQVSKKEEKQMENNNDISSNTENLEEIHQDSVEDNNKTKFNIIRLGVGAIAIVAMGFLLYLGLVTSKLTVDDITIDKWRLTDSSDYGDYYEGTITSKQKKPFVAVIGQYGDKKSEPEFVYVEDGKGIIETYEDTDEDPSIKYRAIGYLSGKSVEISDIKVKYTDSEYSDSSYSDTTNCDVTINIDMNNSKNGLLIFDINNETNNETKRNVKAVVINGKVEYSYYAKLPYKARGIDVSIVPRLFCESDTVTQEDYVVDKEYTAEKDEGKYFTSYSGEMILSFSDYTDGLLIYTRELKDGGNKEDRNIVKNLSTFVFDNECTLTTYDYVDKDETILMPKYEFNIIGYITWKPLEKETI